MTVATHTCPLCGAAAAKGVPIGGALCTIFACPGCRVEFARYSPRSGTPAHPGSDHFRGLNLEQYERSVRSTRERSYNALFARLKPEVGAGRWLDVGCSYGWLLSRAQREGFEAFGVEPSPSAAAAARNNGLTVSVGTFPDQKGSGAPYSVVSFMDVLEHMPDPAQVLLRCRDILLPTGMLLIQVPDRTCVLYMLARFLRRVGAGDFALRRLWLAEFAFPHLFYFNRASIIRLLERSGFAIVDAYRAPIGDPREAFNRVNYAQDGATCASAVVAAAVAGINLLDILWRHGGLLVVMARMRPGAAPR